MPRGERRSGFTLVELLVVLAIVSMLLTLAVPRYFQSIDAARQTVLADNLRQARQVLDKFFQDTGRYPETLDELVERQYLRAVPYDPVLDSSRAWVIVPPPAPLRGKVYDLRTAAPGQDRQGKPYAEY